MISEAEIRRQAALAQVDPMVIDLDYSLGCFLIGLTQIDELLDCLVFKGGTCLRKCYFPGYRFSEDLDFSARRFLDQTLLQSWLAQIAAWSNTWSGPNFSAEPARIEIVEDEVGKETYQVKLYYRGPLVWSGSPRTIRMDITHAEKILLPVVERPIFHPYSDAQLFTSRPLPCYALEEMLLEKLRAIAGQRRFAISRDIYDIHQLVTAGVAIDQVRLHLPAKLQVRGLELDSVAVDRLLARKLEFEQDWQRRLGYLLTSQGAIPFETAWQTTLAVLQTLQA